MIQAGKSRFRFPMRSLNPSALSLKTDEGIVPVVVTIPKLFLRSEEQMKKCMWHDRPKSSKASRFPGFEIVFIDIR
jgi:hypothetical protein